MGKSDYICTFLKQDIDMPTGIIIDNIKKKYECDVSERHVQRVRKDVKKNGFKERVDIMTEKKEDVFNTSDKSLTDLEIDVINYANEGEYSVQEISELTKLSVEDIRDTLKEYSFLVTGTVLDEEDEDVFFTTETETETEETEEMNQLHNDIEKSLNSIDNIINENTFVPVNDDTWEVEIDHVSACSKVPSEVNVFMNKTSRSKAAHFMKWAGAREWLAYLVGERKENGDYNITDLYLPDQRTSSVLVDKVDADDYNNMKIIGVIHSHHEMGAGDENSPSFSGHDDAYINGNHNLSLLAGRDKKSGGFKIVGIARITTPCGGLMRIKANVKRMTESPSAEETALKKEFLEKTQTKKQPVVNVGVQNTGYGNLRVIKNPDGSTTYHYGGYGGYPANQYGRGHCG